MDHPFEFFLFAAEILSAFGLIPDGRIFQSGTDFDQLFCLVVVVKDTSADPDPEP